MWREPESIPPDKAPYLAGVLAWLLPGAGHWYLGLTARAAILFGAITVTFVLGTLIAGVKAVDPAASSAWFFAQIMLGGPCVLSWQIGAHLNGAASFGRAMELGRVYTGVAGLLNLLAILDAVARCHQAQGAVGPAGGRPRRGT